MGENQTDQGEFIPRIGTFLILLGIFFFILFLASDFARQPDFDWLFLGMLAVAVGIVFRRRAPPPPPAGRFALLRKLREEARKRREEKSKKAQKK
ncbi:MAG: hypothetical protein ACOYYJ_17110 [Chloroflexota bacterium]